MGGRILVVDDIATNRVVLKVRLAAAFHEVILAEDGASALRQAQTGRPDLILLDLDLPDMSGIAVLDRLRADPRTRAIPVVMISALASAEDRMAALAAGAVDVLRKPVSDRMLQARIRNLLRGRLEADLPFTDLAEPAADYAAPGRIALVLGRTDEGMALRRRLGMACTDRVFLASRHDTLLAPQGLADVYVIDHDAPFLQAGSGAGAGPGAGAGADGAGTSGLRLLSELRSLGSTRDAGICLWSAEEPDEAAAAQAYDLGADDLLWSAMPAREIALRLAQVLRRRRDLADRRARLRDGLRLAASDPLTGLWNRRYALPRLAAMVEAASAGGTACAVMAIDLDRFKRVNDRWGHAAGDAVLVEVAQRLRRALGAQGLLARLGGEEFLAAQPVTGLAEARALAQHLCAAVEAAPIGLPSATLRLPGLAAAPGGEVLPSVTVTVSVGLALASGGMAVADSMARADHALYAAKSGGRNQVTLWRDTG